MMSADRYYETPAAAFVRACLGGEIVAFSHRPLSDRPLETLSIAEKQTLVRLGLEHELRLHRFKRTMELPRVRKVLGILKGIQPETLLDAGCGRGAFLWPLLDEFPDLRVTCIDTLDYRVAEVEAVRRGGLSRVRAVQMDVTAMTFADQAFDVVTMLEVLEHLPNGGLGLDEVCRVARRFAILSEPSKPDDNSEHLHLYDARTLSRLLQERGAVRVQIDAVLGHFIATARISPS